MVRDGNTSCATVREHVWTDDSLDSEDMQHWIGQVRDIDALEPRPPLFLPIPAHALTHVFLIDLHGTTAEDF